MLPATGAEICYMRRQANLLLHGHIQGCHAASVALNLKFGLLCRARKAGRMPKDACHDSMAAQIEAGDERTFSVLKAA
jgi:hypothetical protein